MASTPYLEHINLRVPSIAKVQAFLCAAFPDFRVRGNGYGPTYGYWTHLGNDDHYLALLQRDNPDEKTGEKVAPYNYQQNFRFMHFGFVVDDVDTLMGRLEEAGFQPHDTKDLNSHPHRRRVYYLDDNGIEYEFVQYLSDKAEERNDYTL